MFPILFFLVILIILGLLIPAFVLFDIIGVKGERKGKTSDELFNKSLNRIEKFLEVNGIEYQKNKKFKIDEREVSVSFYIPDRDASIILGDRYKEHLVSKLDISSIVIEIHEPRETQIKRISKFFGIEKQLTSIEAPQNFREVLEVGKEASEEGIKKAYREKVKETHPDLDGSKEEFMKVKKAYEVLMNKNKN